MNNYFLLGLIMFSCGLSLFAPHLTDPIKGQALIDRRKLLRKRGELIQEQAKLQTGIKDYNNKLAASKLDASTRSNINWMRGKFVDQLNRVNSELATMPNDAAAVAAEILSINSQLSAMSAPGPAPAGYPVIRW